MIEGKNKLPAVVERGANGTLYEWIDIKLINQFFSKDFGIVAEKWQHTTSVYSN